MVKQILLSQNYDSMFIYENKYYFLQENKLHCYDSQFQKIDEYNLKKAYKSIAYDNKSKIYLLSSCEEEILEYDIHTNSQKIIKNKLHLFNIAYINKLKFFPLKCPKNQYSEIINFHYQNYEYIIYQNNSTYISLVQKQSKLMSFKLGDKIKIKSIVINNHKIYLLVEKNQQSYIYLISINCLLTKCFCYFFSKCLNNCYKEEKILNSIANVENSLAQILISEAHKIEKNLSISQNINEILKVNESVEHIITKVTILEQTLISKMEIYFRGKP